MKRQAGSVACPVASRGQQGTDLARRAAVAVARTALVARVDRAVIGAGHFALGLEQRRRRRRAVGRAEHGWVGLLGLERVGVGRGLATGGLLLERDAGTTEKGRDEGVDCRAGWVCVGKGDGGGCG